MINLDLNTKCKIDYTNNFKRQLKNAIKQGKDITLLLEIVTRLANCEKLEPKYKNHQLINNKLFSDCMECHLKPDWLLVYKYIDNNLVLLLVTIGSHSDLFNK